MNGSNKRDPLFDLRASLLTMLVDILRLVSGGDGDEEARERRRGLQSTNVPWYLTGGGWKSNKTRLSSYNPV